jgi:hypothetical protein
MPPFEGDPGLRICWDKVIFRGPISINSLAKRLTNERTQSLVAANGN